MSHEMEMEDFLRLKDAEIAALKEQIDNLVAMVCCKDREIASLSDRLNRMTEALDDALGIRLEQENSELKAEVALLTEQARIITAERDEAREALREIQAAGWKTAGELRGMARKALEAEL